MTPDLNLPPITANRPGTGALAPTANASAVALGLLRPIAAATLGRGGSARAVVVSSLPRSGPFEVLLRLAKAGLPPTGVSVLSRQPLEAGTGLTVQAVSPTRLLAVLDSLATQGAGQAPLTKLDPQLFPQDRKSVV